MKEDFTRRFGFLVNEVARLYGEQFDRLARERIGLTLAQCRLLSALAVHGNKMPMSQVELAQLLGLSAMTVGGMCYRLEAADWIHRVDSPTDRRIRHVLLAPKAEQALDAARNLGNDLRARVLVRLSAAEQEQLITLLGKVRDDLNLIAQTSEHA
jgi:DNA-binding MarR family transcriptional regulator